MVNHQKIQKPIEIIMEIIEESKGILKGNEDLKYKIYRILVTGK